MLQNSFSIRKFRLTKWSFLVHSTTRNAPYIPSSHDSILEMWRTFPNAKVKAISTLYLREMLAKQRWDTKYSKNKNKKQRPSKKKPSFLTCISVTISANSDESLCTVGESLNSAHTKIVRKLSNRYISNRTI